MASTPYFVLGPSTVLSLIGLFKGPDPTEPTPPDDWREATVDVVIPALNEEENIVRCLESVFKQTFKPRQIILVDDGSTDQTVARAEAFCKQHRVQPLVIRRKAPIGKTPTIKRQAREFDSDVEFILDGDTALESDDYIARTVEELYKAIGIASACGTILPLRKRDREALEQTPSIRRFREAHPSHAATSRPWIRDAASGITNLYREVLYLFLQRLVYPGQMACFGTIGNPVGCAVAYRRKYVEAMFDHFTPQLGDDLTNSEDIFIGMAMLNEGYRNIQLTDVYARTVEPEVQRLPRQLYLWFSSFLQSCWYFDALVKSPFKVIKRARARRRGATENQDPNATPVAVPGMSVASPTPETGDVSLQPMLLRHATAPESPSALSGGTPQQRSKANRQERRVIQEPYRQAFGRSRTLEYGRPAGWIVFLGAVEKVTFPVALLVMAILGNWEGLLLTVVVDTIFCVSTLVFIMKGHRTEYFFKGLVVTPLRYGSLVIDLATLGWFCSDLWLTRNRRWRK